MIAAPRSYPQFLRQPTHTHDVMSVTIVLAGILRERVGSAEAVGEPLSLVIKPVEVRHETCFGPAPTRTIQLLLDPHEAHDLARVQPAVREWRWIHGGPFVRPFLQLTRAVRSGNQAEIDLAATDALAAIETLSILRGRPPAVIRAVQNRLDEDTDPPRVTELAREAGMHPVYLARLFRRFLGVTMSQYVRRRRIRKVIQQLGSNASLSRAAYATGFADHAHMCRAFRRETGVTPSEYRSVLQEVPEVGIVQALRHAS